MSLKIKSRKTTYNATRSIHNQGKVAKRIKRTIFGVLILLVLLIMAGLVYTWYAGQSKPLPVEDIPEPRRSNFLPPPTEVEDTVQVGVSAQTFTDKVVVGQNASISVKTNPLAACSISVEYNKERSTDSGLVPKKADAYGVVSWGWTVETSRPVGKWPVSVTCANATKSGVLTLNMNVVNAE